MSSFSIKGLEPLSFQSIVREDVVVYLPHWTAESWGAGTVASVNETILVAEPDQTIQRLVCRDLSREGYRIIPVSSAEEAVRTAARHEGQIDLLCTEALLPTLPGWELAQLLKLDYPKLQVVCMSRGNGATVRMPAPQSNIVVLQNPFRCGRLRKAIRETLKSTKRRTGLRFISHSFFLFLRRCWNA